MSNLHRKKSTIWNHFSVINKDKAKCEYCLKTLSYGGGGTGNLTRHMKKIHGSISIETPIHNTNPRPGTSVQTCNDPNTVETTPIENVEIILPYQTGSSVISSASVPSAPVPSQSQPVQSQIDTYARSTRPLPVSKSKQLDEQLTKFIVKGYHSFAIVEEEEFKNMYKMILPTYTLPTRKTISSSLIPKLYETTKEKVQQLISKADALCLTTDGWTSINIVSYMGLTAHFIDENTELKSVLLGCTEFSDRHTSINLTNFLLSEAEKWEISYKVTGIVTDGAPNIVSAVNGAKWRHFPCVAHNLNLAVQHSLHHIQGVLDQVKAIVQYFKHSSSAYNRLHSMQAQLDLPPLKLKQSVITRWNSTYDMLVRLLKIKDAVVSVLAIEQPRLNTLTPEDWVLIEKCVDVLRLFHEVTEEMSAEKTVSISKVALLTRIMKSHVSKYIAESGNCSEQYKQLLSSLHDELRKRFVDPESDPLASEAAFLDPRFKKYAFVNNEKYEACLRTVKRKLRTLYAQETTTILPESSDEPARPSTSSLWAEFDNTIEQEINRHPTAGSIIEIDKYLNEPLIKRTDKPLQWWKERRLLYPHLYTLMKRRLCVPATSVPCERVFSKAGMIVSAKRSSLKPSKASQVIFLNSNLK